MVQQFLQRLDVLADAVTHRFMESQLEEFKRRIKAQQFESFHAVPLSPAWRKRKAAAGLPVHTMVATGTYLEAMQVVRKASRQGVYSYVIQVDPSVKAVDINGNRRDDITVSEVAFINEYGSQRLPGRPPARPHWGPFLVVFQKNSEKAKADLALAISGLWNTIVNPNQPGRRPSPRIVEMIRQSRTQPITPARRASLMRKHGLRTAKRKNRK